MSKFKGLSLPSVYRCLPEAERFLYALLEARVANLEMNISHQAMPDYLEHIKFVRSHPYRAWHLIRRDLQPVGTIYATYLNEIGMHLMPTDQGKGIGRWALEQFLARMHPLPAIPARRIGAWLANINPANRRSIDFFERAGFALKQYTFQR